MLNPDGFTRWFNQPEFNGTGYPLSNSRPGKLSTLPAPTATLNPYKIFANNLGVNDNYYQWITSGTNAQNRNIFRAGSSNSRRYQLQFPIVGGAPQLKFQYAVIATWEPGDPTKTGDPAVYRSGDFPTSANVEEAFLPERGYVGKQPVQRRRGFVGGNVRCQGRGFRLAGRMVGHNGVPNEVNKIIVTGDFLPGGTQEWTRYADCLSCVARSSEFVGISNRRSQLRSGRKRNREFLADCRSRRTQCGKL